MTSPSDASPGPLLIKSGALTGPVHDPDTVARRAGAIARLLRPAAGLVATPESRPAAGSSAVQQSSRNLFGGKDPLVGPRTPLRDVQHFYSQSVAGPVVSKMKRAIAANDRLYVHGAERTVGVSTLLMDFARAFNFQAANLGDDRRILYVAIGAGTATVRMFLDQLAEAAQAPFSLSELKGRNHWHLAMQTIAAMRTLRIGALMLDHVHNLEKKPQAFLSDLIAALDPGLRQVALTLDEFEVPAARIGLIVATHLRPTQFFQTLPHVAHAFQGNAVTLGRYKSVETIAEAMAQAGIGIDDIDLSREADALLVAEVLEQTEGNPAVMGSLFRLLDAWSRANGGKRPDLRMLAQVLEEYKILHRRRRGSNWDGDDEPDSGMAGAAVRQPQPRKPPPQSAAQREPGMAAPRSAAAAQQLKRMNAESDGDSRIKKEVLRAKRDR